MKNHEPALAIMTFVSRLAALGSGERAHLKRNAGRPLNEASDTLGLFYGLLPEGVPVYQEEVYFMVATLYPLAASAAGGDLGAALAHVRARQPQMAKGLDRRMEVLLDSDGEQLAFRLRQAVHFLQSAREGVCWAALLEDLLSWGHPERWVQKRWARSYYGTGDQH